MGASDSNQILLSKYVVAYFDVLGQREKLNQLKKIPTTDNEREEFNLIASQTYGTVRNLRDGLKTSFDLFKQVTNDNMPQTDSEQLTIDHQLTFFSDSFAVTSPYDDDLGNPLIENIFGLLVSLSGMMIDSLANHSPVRGALDVGKGFPWPEGGVYGPVMCDVYKLESEVANYPRIIIGKELHGIICDWAKKPGEKNEPYVKYGEVIDACNQLVYIDQDGMATLDYLGQTSYNIMVRNPGLKRNVKFAWEFINQEYDKFKKVPEPKMALRYSLLKEYFLSRLDIWGF